MKITKDLYQGSLALLTDFYQLTMAYAYWKSGKGEQEAVFNLFFRKHPFQGGFTLAAGLDYVIDYCSNFRFGKEDIEYLSQMKAPDGSQQLKRGFWSI
jgi:nicotinate phosphoribosyltransferase